MYKIVVPANALASWVLLAIMVLVGDAAWVGFGDAKLAQRWSQHTFEVLGAIEHLNVAILNAETGEQGYLLTGDDDYLATYQVAVGRVGLLQDQLRQLTADNAGQQDRLSALAPVLRARLDKLAQGVQLRRDVGFDAALGVMRTGVGSELMTQVEAMLAAITGEERLLLATRQAKSDSRLVRLIVLVLGGTSLGILTLFWAVRILNRAAMTDALTGLLSRNRMWRLLTARNRDAKRPKAALLTVDLDRFRSVNQVFGPTVGDKLLVEVGRRLTRIARKCHVGRLGSDDFAIYRSGGTPADAEALGLAATAVLARPFDVEGHSFHLTASVGVAHCDTAGEVDLRQGADDAMHVAKRQGGNQAVAFVRSMHIGSKELAELEQDLHLALEKENELFMAYQPVVRIADGALVAVEALARWSHPRLGAIPPDRFIDLAETRSLMLPLGLKLMGMTIRQAALWHDRYPGKCPALNINISSVQFASGDLLADLAELLHQHSLPASAFCIEVTEGGFAHAKTIRALLDARQRGFRVAMDDFGVGYSSLAQLPRLPLTSVKLDRSFIVHAERAGDAAMLAAIVQLAHALAIEVVAEGVETAEQLELLAGCGCDAAQGYLYARPLTPEALEAWLSGERSAAVQEHPTGHPLPI